MNRFEKAEIRYLTLAAVSEIHPLWGGINNDIPLDSINPEDLVDMTSNEYSDEWIEWLLMSHPIIVIERQIKKTPDQDPPRKYYRVMGHSSWQYVTRFIGDKYGTNKLKELTFPITVLEQKKISSQKDQLLTSELVFSFLLQKSKRHRDIMVDYLLNGESKPVNFLSNQSQISRFAKISKSSIVRNKPDLNESES